MCNLYQSSLLNVWTALIRAGLHYELITWPPSISGNTDYGGPLCTADHIEVQTNQVKQKMKTSLRA